MGGWKSEKDGWRKLAREEEEHGGRRRKTTNGERQKGKTMKNMRKKWTKRIEGQIGQIGQSDWDIGQLGQIRVNMGQIGQSRLGQIGQKID